MNMTISKSNLIKYHSSFFNHEFTEMNIKYKKYKMCARQLLSSIMENYLKELVDLTEFNCFFLIN